jgi:RES domain-containing protein
MIAFRLGHRRYPLLDGGGAFLHGSRWCTPGRYIVHMASTYSLAVLENLVHWQLVVLPPEMSFIQASIPEEVPRTVPESAEVPGWDRYPYGPSQAYGDAWYDAMDTAVLVVPSVLSPFEHNVLLNRKHGDFSRITVGGAREAILDRRLFVRL